jgi:hypothetical protein
MKALLIIIITFIQLNAFSQADSNKLFFNELHVSANRTNVKNDNTSNKNGFGVAIYRVGKKSKVFNLLFGFEYNKTSQFKKNGMYLGRFASITDVTYNLNCLSIPIGYRINMGKKVKFFIEQDFYVDLTHSSKMKGDYLSDIPGQPQTTSYEKLNADLYSFNFGVSLGLGLRIPIKKYELILKPDYKLGIRNLSPTQSVFENSYFRLSVGIRL